MSCKEYEVRTVCHVRSVCDVRRSMPCKEYVCDVRRECVV